MHTATASARPRRTRPSGRYAIAVGLLASALALAACESDSGVTAGTSASDGSAAAVTDATTAASAASPAPTDSAATLPATTVPPTTAPPTTGAPTTTAAPEATTTTAATPDPTTTVAETAPPITVPPATVPPTTAPPVTAAPPTTAAPIVIGGLTLASCIASDLFGITMSQPRAEVALYQYTLRNLGYDPGTIDGYFGPATMEAAAYEIIDHTTDNAGLFIDDGVIYQDAFIRLGLAC